jgi:hypothetical protein
MDTKLDLTQRAFGFDDRSDSTLRLIVYDLQVCRPSRGSDKAA